MCDAMSPLSPDVREGEGCAALPVFAGASYPARLRGRVDRSSLFCRPQQRIESTRLSKRVGASEKRFPLATDCGAQVFELAQERVGRSCGYSLDRPVSAQLDHRLNGVPRVGEEQGA